MKVALDAGEAYPRPVRWPRSLELAQANAGLGLVAEARVENVEDRLEAGPAVNLSCLG